jgi:hypothetical protein
MIIISTNNHHRMAAVNRGTLKTRILPRAIILLLLIRTLRRDIHVMDRHLPLHLRKMEEDHTTAVVRGGQYHHLQVPTARVMVIILGLLLPNPLRQR